MCVVYVTKLTPSRAWRGLVLRHGRQPDNGEGEPRIVPQVTQTKAQAMKELRSLTADEQWRASATAALPE